MNCERCREMLVDLLLEDRSEEGQTDVKAHIADCALCRAELKWVHDLWVRLGILMEEPPGPDLRRRFYDTLAAETGPSSSGAARPDIRHRRRYWWMAAAAIVLLACGWILGFAMQIRSQRAEVALLHRELDGIRMDAAISQIRQPLAADRMMGLTWCRQTSAPSPELLRALLERLNEDSNTNVRLATLDTLMGFARDPEVRSGLIGALPHQDDPLVQLSLIEALTGMRDLQAVEALERLLGTPYLNAAVDREARRSLQSLRKM